MNEQLTQTPPEVLAAEPAEAEDVEYISPEKAANLVFHAFHITQRSNGGLDLLFTALHTIRPNLELSDEAVVEAQEIFGRRVSNYLKASIVTGENALDEQLPEQIHHSLIPNTEVDKQVHGIKSKIYPKMTKFPSAVKRLASKLNRQDLKPREKVLADLEENITFTDIHFIKRPQGRLRRGVEGNLADSRYSVLIRHAFFGQSTGVPEYDQIFGMIAKRWEKSGGPDPELVDLYNQHHENKIDVATWLGQRSGNGTPRSEQTPGGESL